MGEEKHCHTDMVLMLMYVTDKIHQTFVFKSTSLKTHMVLQERANEITYIKYQCWIRLYHNDIEIWRGSILREMHKL